MSQRLHRSAPRKWPLSLRLAVTISAAGVVCTVAALFMAGPFKAARVFSATVLILLALIAARRLGQRF